MNLIDFSKETTTKPPLTTKLTDAELVGYVSRERLAPNTIPCHSQNVERVVADVAQAAKNNMGHEKRHKSVLPTDARKLTSTRKPTMAQAFPAALPGKVSLQGGFSFDFFVNFSCSSLNSKRGQ